jgi:hypothetical protein
MVRAGTVRRKPCVDTQSFLTFLGLSVMSKKPVRVAVTGAAGQIGCCCFRIASGEILGKNQPVILQLLEVPVEGPQKRLRA